MRTADEVRALMLDFDRSVPDMFGISEAEFKERYTTLANKLNDVWWSAPGYFTDVKLAAEILDKVVGYPGYTAIQLFNFTCFVRMISILMTKRAGTWALIVPQETTQ